MNSSVKTRKHILVDRIPIICAAVLILLAQFTPGILIADLVEKAYCAITHENLLEDYIMVGKELPDILMNSFVIASIVYAFLMLIIFEWWFKPEYDGSLHIKGFGIGMKVAAPIMIFWVIWFIIQIVIGTSTVGALTLEGLLKGFRAGAVEEVAYRGIGVALLLRKFKSKDNILLPTIITAAVFGISHLVNIFSSGDVGEVLTQTIFAMVFGIISGLIFTYSGNIWPTIIFHSLYDTAVFVITGVGDGFSWTNIIDIIGPFVIMIFMLFMFRKDKDSLVKLWSEKWK